MYLKGLFRRKFPKLDEISINFQENDLKILTNSKNTIIQGSQFHSLGVANGDRVELRK